MTEPNQIRCLLCRQIFERNDTGTFSYLHHRLTCNRTSQHPSTPKESA